MWQFTACESQLYVTSVGKLSPGNDGFSITIVTNVAPASTRRRASRAR
jgi:hypothetical protein